MPSPCLPSLLGQVRTHVVIARLGYGGGARGLLSKNREGAAHSPQRASAGIGRSAEGVAYQGVDGASRHPLHDIW